MNNVKVSIIIPVYNTSRYLKQCIDSVITQTYQDLQIILVDDGSTDNSLKICENYQCLDNRIEVIHKKNEGLGYTRNVGLEYVEGTYVTFLDSDDWIDRNHIANLVHDITKTNADVVIGGNRKCKNDGSLIEETLLPYYGVYENNSISEKIMLSIIAADDTSKRDLGIPMSVCFNLYASSIIKYNKILFSSERECVSEDLFFNLQFLKYAKRVFLSHETGYFYRYNPISITRRFNEKQIPRTYCFYKKLVTEVINLGIVEKADLRVKRCVIAKLRGLLLMIVYSNNTIKYKLKIMDEILESDTAEKVLCQYPLDKYRFSLKLTTWLMKKKAVHLLYLILSLKKWMKK